MSKTNKTRQLEAALWGTSVQQGHFGCFEVTIGWYGQEIVDFITYLSTGEFRCYEIKVSVADFKSKAKLSFHGDYNYYVIPEKLLHELRKNTAREYGSEDLRLFDTQIKNSKIGLITVSESGMLTYLIRAKRKSVNMGMKATLLESMVRSMNREVKKFYTLDPYWELTEGEDLLC